MPQPTWYERVGNVHVHSTYSDGTSEPQEIARIAAEVGLDFCIITDHNAHHAEHGGWYGHTLLLIGEEIHRPSEPEQNHLLVFGADKDLSGMAQNTQRVISQAKVQGGHTYLAHPYERSGKVTGEPEIDWTNWDVRSYSGLEIWNYMSEFKGHLSNLPMTLLYAFLPKLAITGPYAETLQKWDQLTSKRSVAAIAGSDAHAMVYRMGPLRRRIFSYKHLFRSLNMHVLLPKPWSGDAASDGCMVHEALAHGRSYVAYDGLASGSGFSFIARSGEKLATMGDRLAAHGPITFQARLPRPALVRLIHNGRVTAEARGSELNHESAQPGVYRVEAHRTHLFKRRGWLYSNPIYVDTPGTADEPRPQHSE